MSDGSGRQDKESFGSNTSHEEKAVSFFEDARDLSLCSTSYEWGIRETPHSWKFHFIIEMRRSFL